MKVEAIKLANALGQTNEHPDYPEMDWQECVAKGETREGYWDWVISEMYYSKHAWLDF